MNKRTIDRILKGGVLLFFLFATARIATNYFGIPVFTYPNFGIGIPGGYSVIGIDVSHYQKKINWQQVSEMRDLGMKIDFVFIKATEGTSLSDHQFNRNWEESKDKNIIRGAYLFLDPRSNGVRQAKHYIQRVKLEPGDLPPVIDIEELRGASASQCRRQTLACARTLEEHYKVRPLLYSYTSFYTNYLGEAFDQYPLWIAHYKTIGKPCIQRDWHIWQHSDKGKVNGIGSPVDFNVFNGSLYQLKQLTID